MNHLRCSGCKKVLLNYQFGPGVTERVYCLTCLGTIQNKAFRTPMMGSELFGNHRDEWEDEATGDRGGIGWYKKGS